MVLLPPRNTTVDKIYQFYQSEARKSQVRPHLGASEIGKECDRAIWYSFRWVVKNVFAGRMLRLFETGNLEENRLVSNLTAIGTDVRQFDLKTGKQFRMEMLGGHFAGSLDGIAIGVVEAPKTWHLTEFKTHNEKSFKSLIKSGVKVAKPEHYAQMQSYMGMSHDGLGGDAVPPLSRALYLAVNKNTDELYAERLEYDPAEYFKVKEKARRLIFASRPPAKMTEDASYFVCKFCTFKDVCHGKQDDYSKPEKNCRTCLYSTPQFDGSWLCEKYNKKLCLQEQVQGCEKHLFIPDLLPFKQVDATENSVVYNDDSGNVITNWEGGELVKITARNSTATEADNSKNKLPWES